LARFATTGNADGLVRASVIVESCSRSDCPIFTTVADAAARFGRVNESGASISKWQQAGRHRPPV
jgi:hypothetical protein